MSAMRPANQRGMTLVELLVTVVVLSILLAMVGSILVSVMATQKKVGAAARRERVGSAILDLIARDLVQVYAYDVTSAFKGESDTAQSGDADRMEFIAIGEPSTDLSEETAPGDEQKGAPVPAAAADPRTALGQREVKLMQVGYFVRESQAFPGLLTLFRSEAVYVPPPPPATGGTGPGGTPLAAAPAATGEASKPAVVEVYDRVRSFNLRYLDEPQPGQREWKDAWSEPARAPLAVEVVVEIVPDPKAEEAAGMAEERKRRIYVTIAPIMAQGAPPPRGP